MAETRTCKWHNCQSGPDSTRATFHPVRSDQEFCSKDCRLSRVAWKQARGAKMVDPLLAHNWSALERIRKEIEKEMKS